MEDRYIVSPGVNGDGHEGGFVQFIFRQLRLDPLHVVRDDWADVQAVREEEGDGEGGVGGFIRIRPGCPITGRQCEILDSDVVKGFTVRRPTVNGFWRQAPCEKQKHAHEDGCNSRKHTFTSDPIG